jgi:hypothetical protein
LLRNWASIAT